MEETLTQISKEASGAKHVALRKAIQETLDLLRDDAFVASAEPYQLRERCLLPLQLSLETKNNKLCFQALGGIQKLLTDERFHGSMESQQESRWLPMQILAAVASTPSLSEDVQVEVMRLLLNMALSTAWCMNARVLTNISELLFDVLHNTSKLSLRNTVINALFRILEVVYHRHAQTFHPSLALEPQNQVVLETCGGSPHVSVKTAVKATLTQLLTSLAERLKDKPQPQDSEANNVLDDFVDNGAKGDLDSLSRDVIIILKYLCEKLSACQGSNQGRQMEPLVLEGIYAILSKLPAWLRHNDELVDLIWQQLCPLMIVILGNPMTDKSVTSHKAAANPDEVGRGSGCSSTAPSVHSMSAKIIYGIAVELVRVVGCFQSLRPVLESVFHRMLLYPPPVHRLEAVKAVKELLSTPARLLDLAGPTIPDPAVAASSLGGSTGNKKKQHSDLSLLKLIMDSIQECCHCNESAVCITTVSLVNELLATVEGLLKGHGLTAQHVTELLRKDACANNHTHAAYASIPTTTTITPITLPTTDPHPLSAPCVPDGPETLAGPVSAAFGPVAHPGGGSAPDDTGLSPGDATDSGLDSSPGENEARRLHDEREVKEKFRRLRTQRTMDFEAAERRSGRRYVELLASRLPELLRCDTTTEVDELLQKFSSDVCSSLMEQPGDDGMGAILNADGVYLATYSSLLLNLKLLNCGYYESDEKSLPMAEQQFVDDILSTDLLVYLSEAWLSEVFHEVIQTNLLEESGYKDAPLSYRDCALTELLTDVDGLESRKVGGQQLCAFRDDRATADPTDILGQPVSADDKDAMEAGAKFARDVLSISWDAILDVLSVLLNGKSSCGITSSLALMLNAREESKKARDAICASLDGLQRAARLSCVLGLQDRCGAAFGQLAFASCVVELEDIKRERERERQPAADKKAALPSVLANKPKLARLHAAHALSMDVVLTIGLEMASHSADCWPHVFRCCAHISELEHTYFSQGNNQSNLPKVQQEQHSLDTPSEDIDFHDAAFYSTVMRASEPVAPTIRVSDVIKQSGTDAGWDSPVTGGGVLSASDASKVLCGLSQEVDRLYEEAANRLNMKALVHFLRELCQSSRQQLASLSKTSAGGATGGSAGGAPPPSDTLWGNGNLPSNALHLYRLGDVMLKCLRSNRPLLHVMRAWSVVAPHFVEAACHRDHGISKKAVQCIHEVVTTLLSNQPELPHFHFHESLCKPFENLLCLELCDGDIQDQIVCSICELVEACTSEIKSGWRSLFGALRAVRIEYTTSEEVNEARQRHVAAVLDVFNVFLNTDNVLVFANAAVDCILCLLKYARGPGEFEEIPDDDSDSGSDYPETGDVDNLILPALQYLRQCSVILSSMCNMPACPIFNGAHRIKADILRSVDPVIPNMNLEAFQKHFRRPESPPPEIEASESLGNDVTATANATITQNGHHAEAKMEEKADSKSVNSMDSGIEGPLNASTASDFDSQHNSPNQEKGAERADDNQRKDAIKAERAAAKREKKKQKLLAREAQGDAREEDRTPGYVAVSLDQQDNHTGVVRVWYLILEGLASTVSACPRSYQPQTLEMLFELLRSASQVPGPAFALHCVNHLLMPMLQSWLRRANQLTGYWDGGTTANFKQCAGLCADLVVELTVQLANVDTHQLAVEYMLKQLMNVLTECIAQPVESLSRLGCACIRHSLLSCGPVLTEPMWFTAAAALHQAVDVSLYSLRQLMTPFQPNSDNFYGDIGQVKVAARKDCSSLECERIRQLAQQVFLLDSQRGGGAVVDLDVEEDRSYIFLIYPPGQEQGAEEPVTRVSFRSIVVGLLSHQILIQTVGCLLLQGSSNMVPSERSMIPGVGSRERDSRSSSVDIEDGDPLIQESPLPGMMRYLSCRNLMVMLRCLRQSYHTASQFDARPGLKFLIQKVARAEVAANLYKQAGVSLTFYMHALVELVARQDNVCVVNTKRMLLPDRDTAKGSEAAESSDSEYEAGLDLSDPDDNGDGGRDGAKVDLDLEAARLWRGSPQAYIRVLVRQMKATFDEVCTDYVDLYLDREGPNAADRLSGQMLVFLLIQPEEIPTLKRDKSLKEMVAEKLRIQKKEAPPVGIKEVLGDGVDSMDMVAGGILPLQPFSVQGDLLDDPVPPPPPPPPAAPVSAGLGLPEGATPASPERAAGPHRAPEADRVYTVATDRTIRSMMTQYKKRKQVHAMPTFIKAGRSKPSPSTGRRDGAPPGDPAQQEIEQQQKSSIMKDSEAHLNSWIEMICNVLQLLHQLPDYQYQALLPIVFNCVNQLICHCKDTRLREVLAQWTYRIGHLYGFAPPGDLPP